MLPFLLAHAGHDHGTSRGEWISIAAVALGVLYAGYLLLSKRWRGRGRGSAPD